MNWSDYFKIGSPWSADYATDEDYKAVYEKYMLKEASRKSEKRPDKKANPKTYLFVYNDEDVIVERLTKAEIKAKVKELQLEKDEYTVIEGQIVSKL